MTAFELLHLISHSYISSQLYSLHMLIYSNYTIPQLEKISNSLVFFSISYIFF